MILKPRRPLERNIRACSGYGCQSWRNERTESASNIGRSNVFDWAGAVRDGLLVAPHDPLDAAREFEVDTRVESGIAAYLLENSL
jgi:hypothetical protein